MEKAKEKKEKKENWLEVLRAKVAQLGAGAVAKELGVSPTMITLVMGGKYGANTANIQRTVETLYGNDGRVTCPVLGETDAANCSRHFRKAREVGAEGGNRQTKRLRAACLSCANRKAGK